MLAVTHTPQCLWQKEMFQGSNEGFIQMIYREGKIPYFIQERNETF